MYPEGYYKNPNNCQAIYENECLPSCLEDKCLIQADPALVTCIPIEENVKVFNDILTIPFKASHLINICMYIF